MTDDERQKALAGKVYVADAVAALKKGLAREGGAEYGLMSDDGRAAVRKSNRIIEQCIGVILSIAETPGAEDSSEPTRSPHLRFRRHALERALAIDPGEFAGDLSDVDCGTIEGMARTLAIVSAGYNWTVSDDGRLAACVAGDQGFATTGILVDQQSSAGDVQ